MYNFSNKKYFPQKIVKFMVIFGLKFVMPYRKEDALQFSATVVPCRAN